MSDLGRRVEECCLNGWAAISEVLYDGWVLRLSRGHTKRANSVSPLFPGTMNLERKIAYCEERYAAHHLPTIFRLSSVMGFELDETLDRLAYLPAEDETRMLTARLMPPPFLSGQTVELNESMPGDGWLQALARFQNLSAHALEAHRQILEAMAVSKVFAGIQIDGSIRAIAFGAVHDGMVCVNSVATDPLFVRRGLARQAIEAVLDWSYRKADAREACVPVVAKNHAAVALYQGLGFEQEAGRYHYRRKALPG